MKYFLSLLLLAGCSGGGGSDSVQKDQYCDTLIENQQPIGVSFIHGLQPQATEQVETLKQALLKSCVRRLAANFLVDGSFGSDFSILSAFVSDLSVSGRELHLIMYLQNGSSQRRWKNTAVVGLGGKTEPSKFRDKILHDGGVREQYRALVRRLLPVVDALQATGGTAYFVVGLEDNLQLKHALEVKKIGNEALGGRFVVWVRNPCPGCYSGNDESTDGFDMRERHAQGTAFATASGIVTNDGFDLGREALATLRDAAFAKDNVFLAWDKARQGIPRDGRYLEPSKRVYYIPTQGEFDDLVAFLRE